MKPKRNFSIGDIVRVKCPGQRTFAGLDQSKLVGKMGKVTLVSTIFREVQVTFDEGTIFHFYRGGKDSFPDPFSKRNFHWFNPDHLRLVFSS